eukprot:scaffold37720_cov67-Phaeocystis_antarctica.AAC.11
MPTRLLTVELPPLRRLYHLGSSTLEASRVGTGRRGSPHTRTPFTYALLGLRRMCPRILRQVSHRRLRHQRMCVSSMRFTCTGGSSSSRARNDAGSGRTFSTAASVASCRSWPSCSRKAAGPTAEGAQGARVLCSSPRHSMHCSHSSGPLSSREAQSLLCACTAIRSNSSLASLHRGRSQVAPEQREA